MSAVHHNMQQLASHWRDLQQKNQKESTTKKRGRTEYNVRTVKTKIQTEIQNRKIVKIKK